MKTLLDTNSIIFSYWGMYAVQSVLHSLVASVLVECAFIAGDIRTPRVKQRFRLLVIFLPVASFPFYQLISPDRGNMYFRLESLLDSNKWFLLELWGFIPLFMVFASVLVLASLIFLIQEFLPMIFNMLEQMRGDTGATADASEEVDEAAVQKVSTALEGLPFDVNAVEILNDPDPELFSSTGLNPRIFISTGLIKSFSAEHLQAAFAHEIGHIQRSRRPFLILAYILRVLMFYNPIAMIEFRKLAHEEEKVCDDIAVALTGKPGALFEAVEMLRPAPEEYDFGAASGGVRGITTALEQYSNNMLLKSRASRLGHNSDDSLWGVFYVTTLALILGINYFIV
jgi:Zn-dependent protease with chaperone function